VIKALDYLVLETISETMNNVDFQNNDGKSKITGDNFIKLYEGFVEEYPILSIEDPFDQDDWAHYTKLTAGMGEKVQIVGDDLLVTNPKVNYPCSLLGLVGHELHTAIIYYLVFHPNMLQTITK
jgi:enolase